MKNDVILTSDEVRSLAIRGYYRRVIEQAATMLEEIPVDQREYGALIFNLHVKHIPELKEKLKGILNELHAWSLTKTDEQSAVIQFLFQMYPQTKIDLGN